MVKPFWVVNSSLVSLCFLTSLLIYLMRVTIPAREDIEPSLYSMQHKEQNIDINIRHIYENDLFNTYVKELPESKASERIDPVPEPPVPQRIFVPEPPKPMFLESLNITLKGIVIVGFDDQKNSVLISDNKTDQETAYKIGDVIQDAQIIRIFSNKVVLLRNNGQQEVLYLHENDAKMDPMFTSVEDWSTVVHRNDATNFTVYPGPFMKRIESLPQFIEYLLLTTAYQKGEPVGARIGAIGIQSIGANLGLIPGDILLSINGIPTTTTQNRVAIYNQVTERNLPMTIDVSLLRNGRTVQFVYHVDTFKQEIISIKTPASKLIPGAGSNVNEVDNKKEYEEVQDFEPTYASEDFEEDMFAQIEQKIRNHETMHMLVDAIPAHSYENKEI
ncbi:MAG TPA: type II secretion system protein N [Patescibacteria group bacterium]|jgi:type II secretory pathway component PulC|nr:type II secretion system protein N [Patescibacteria group bacterium]